MNSAQTSLLLFLGFILLVIFSMRCTVKCSSSQTDGFGLIDTINQHKICKRINNLGDCLEYSMTPLTRDEQKECTDICNEYAEQYNMSTANCISAFCLPKDPIRHVYPYKSSNRPYLDCPCRDKQGRCTTCDHLRPLDEDDDYPVNSLDSGNLAECELTCVTMYPNNSLEAVKCAKKC